MKEQLKNTFSIITPSFNSEEYILESLESVFNQKGDFNIEHIVVDGKSTDNTVEIIKEFEKEHHREGYTFRWISEKDSGMYDAILKGFAMSSGNIMAWINTDDKYQEGAFEAVNDIFIENSKAFWIKGITYSILKNGTIRKGQNYKYIRSLIKRGYYGPIGQFIQQESLFWRKELWMQVNHDEIRRYRLAGDFRLWQLFAEKAELIPLGFPVSYFRKRDGQLSANIEEYFKEVYLTTHFTRVEQFFLILFAKYEKLLKLILRN